MTLEQLQNEAKRYGLTETENRDVLITAILQHLQLCGSMDLAGEAREEGTDRVGSDSPHRRLVNLK